MYKEDLRNMWAVFHMLLLWCLDQK